MAVKNTISRRKHRKMQKNFHNRIMTAVYQDPSLLGQHAPRPDTIIFKTKDPPIIYAQRNTRIDVIFVYLLKDVVEILAIEIKTGSIPQIAKGLIQLKNTRKNFSDYWLEWFEKNRLFGKLIPFLDYELYLSLILLEEKFTKPIEEWATYKRRFKIANIKRQDNFFKKGGD